MAALPDRFDLGVTYARGKLAPERQAEFLLGGMMALPAWYFLNLGSTENPLPCTVEGDEQAPEDRHLLVFTDSDRLETLAQSLGHNLAPPPVISMSPAQALPWSLGHALAGLLINPGEYAFLLPQDQLRHYHQAWQARGGRETIGFWIPNLTTEEEDFWQEHGL